MDTSWLAAVISILIFSGLVSNYLLVRRTMLQLAVQGKLDSCGFILFRRLSNLPGIKTVDIVEMMLCFQGEHIDKIF